METQSYSLQSYQMMALIFKDRFMKQILFLTTSVMFLLGCGGGSSSNSGSSAPEPEPPSDIVMVISQPYTVYPGDQVVKTVPEALLQIIHTDEHNESTVVLIEGNATIIRKQ